MNYDQALSFLHGIARFGAKPGLRRVRLLLERMGNPQDKLRFIHVAGTNGKGSTCAMLSRVLSRAGYKTGLYISPFVLDFRERIQIDNEMIPHQDVARGAELVREHWDALDRLGDTPSEFETLVAVAFDWFLRQNADIIVLEVGMGGRFDATNVIAPPVASVITSLSLDHTEYLGSTLADIAFEKCGIVKRGGITISYPRQRPEAMEVIARRCAEEDNQLIVGGEAEVLGMDFFGTRIRYGGLELEVPLAGEHQVCNAVTVVEALRAAGRRGFPVSGADVVQGIASTRFPARLEVLSRSPLIVLDGAHNTSGAQVLGKALSMLEGRRIHAVMGMLGNKDVPGALAEIAPHLASLTAVPVITNPLSMPAHELAALARPLCQRVDAADDPAGGVKSALARCEPGDALLVCGSLYLASYLRPILIELAGGGPYTDIQPISR